MIIQVHQREGTAAEASESTTGGGLNGLNIITSVISVPSGCPSALVTHIISSPVYAGNEDGYKAWEDDVKSRAHAFGNGIVFNSVGLIWDSGASLRQSENNHAKLFLSMLEQERLVPGGSRDNRLVREWVWSTSFSSCKNGVRTAASNRSTQIVKKLESEFQKEVELKTKK